MFQSTLLKRAARLATPAAAAAATTVGVVVSMTSSEDDDIIIMKSSSPAAALCDDKKEHESVMSMLGDIQSRVSFIDLLFVVVGSVVFMYAGGFCNGGFCGCMLNDLFVASMICFSTASLYEIMHQLLLV